MDATPTTVKRFLHSLLLCSVMLCALVATTVRAQEPDEDTVQVEPTAAETLEIIDVQHHADGTLLISAGAAPPGATVERFSAFVDNVQAKILNVDIPGRDPASIVIAIDTSGSMAGTPIESAKDAALRLVSRLEPEDSVAIVSFSATPQVLSTFTTNRSTTESVLQSVTAQGDTALYDAVTRSAELLDSQTTSGAKVLVLLSDGQDTASGGSLADPDVENPQRQISLNAAAASGIEVHAFALAEADEAYLTELVDTTDGTLSQVATDDSLGSLFESLGSRLAATFQFEVSAQPLSQGTHRVELVAYVDGLQVRRSGTFDAMNSGLVTATVDPSSDPELLEVALNTLVPAALLKIDASIDGDPVTYSNGRVFVDTWEFDPGNRTLEITASVADELAYRTEIAIDVPELQPQFDVSIDTSGLVDQLVVSGRAQGPGPHTLRVLADGEEIASSEDRDIRVDYESKREITVQFVSQGGRIIAEKQIEAETLLTPPSTGGGSPFSLNYALPALALIAAGAAAIYLLRKRRLKNQPKQRRLRRFTAPRELPGRPNQAGPLGVLRLLNPDGSERAIPLGQRPITIGSSHNCDIVIEGEGIQPLHARVSARGNGEFQIHGLGSNSANPFGKQGSEEWVVLHVGESIALGDYQITIAEAESERAESA